MKCNICNKSFSFFHYLYNGSSKPFVEFPTCRKCFSKAKRRVKTESDILCSDELALFRINKLSERIRVLEKLSKLEKK